MRRLLASACLFALLACAPAALSASRYVSAGPNHLRGTPAADTLVGRARDYVDCGPGYDTVYVNLRSERTRHCERRIYVRIKRPRHCRRGGTPRSETVLGTSHGDRCRGRAGDDIVEGAGGSDRLFG